MDFRFRGDKHKRIYFQLDDVDSNTRLRVVDNESIELSLEVYPETLLEVFSEDDITSILDPDSGVNHHLKATVAMNDLPLELVGWVTKKYRSPLCQHTCRL